MGKNFKAMLETLEKHGPATAGPVLGKLRRQLAQDTDERRKIKLWRHNAIAHRTDEGRDPEFFVRNKLDVEAAEKVLVELEDMLNQASLATMNTYVNVKHGSKDNVLHAKLLLADLGLATRVAASAAR